ncbi:hypothetical protein SAMN04488067_10839 [Halorubrum xinjiangense]|uniref:Uncharacterized protein n=1 Tax=Halorubrum xinjiangense TaxID=261291 RepID=A0A1G7NN12_9EURY|nr:hypothetical protein [Halorubrum xinjiangense]SDF75475.1 hypothetical protein SAMN04488067_10839 [Halorubrum xinjiangense]
MNRRYILASAAAASISLAGCSGSAPDESTSPNGSGDGSNTEEDEDGSETQSEESEDSTPSLGEFAYPTGTDRSGVDAGELFNTHESTLVDAGSLTLDQERVDIFDGNEFSRTLTNEFEANNISVGLTEDGETEQFWSPADEDVAYVRLESGFDQAYRVDERAPPAAEVTGLNEFNRYLTEVEWGEATEVVEVADGYGVTYESVGYSDRLSFGEMEEFDAAITVSESGYVSDLEYAQTEDRNGDTVEIDAESAVMAVGETTVEEPDWAETAREEGVRFDVTFTDDGTAFRLELTNGDEVSTEARVRLRDGRGSASRNLSQALSVGDVLFVGLSETGDLVTDSDGAPEGARGLTGDIRLTVRTMFPLLTHTRRP